MPMTHSSLEGLVADALMASQAAEAEEVKLKEAIRLRGCNEEFIADPALLTEGKVWQTHRIDLGCTISPCASSDCLLLKFISSGC